MITNYILFNEMLDGFVDKRTDTKPKEVLQDAVNKIRSLGVKHPFDSSTIIGDVLVEVSNFDGYVRLNSIFSMEKKKGKANEVMQMICDIADEFQVTITLSPEPFGNDKSIILNKEELTNWYKKFGFVEHRFEDMKRNPK